MTLYLLRYCQHRNKIVLVTKNRTIKMIKNLIESQVLNLAYRKLAGYKVQLKINTIGEFQEAFLSKIGLYGFIKTRKNLKINDHEIEESPIHCIFTNRLFIRLLPKSEGRESIK